MDVKAAKKAFQKAHPGIAIGIAGSEEEPMLAARPQSFDEALKLPEEFEGFPVQVRIVPNIRSRKDE